MSRHVVKSILMIPLNKPEHAHSEVDDKDKVTPPNNVSEVMSLQDAVERTEGIEDGIRAIKGLADQATFDFLQRHVLGKSFDEWPSKFSDRLRLLNKQYRHRIKTSLRQQDMQLFVLHGQVGGLNPHANLLEAMNLALDTCRKAYNLQQQVRNITEKRVGNARLSETKSYMFTRPLRRVEGTVDKLREEEDYIRTTYKEWGSSFLLFDPPNLIETLTALKNRKPMKTLYLEECDPLFIQLSKISVQQDKLLAEVKSAGTNATIAWFGWTTDTVTAVQLAEQTGHFQGLSGRMKATHTSQSKVLEALEDMAHRAETTPPTLPGPDGTEMLVERILKIVDKYEELLARCHRTHMTAESTVSDLKTVILPL
ncbi:hypothetical protein L226DRAFT_573130 [Lentinus tigrinus ALCF2SS1-7]|uniref:uncharacterized protein n=1 Tax=Lentinus tigrinus ALCF2SS1-7 TaxID=1328758 RepID=UPI001165F0D3|nr:hypothetical protein L226DRAFT_573130 [Lentinus tigrinus ALCF2SS1-7]